MKSLILLFFILLIACTNDKSSKENSTVTSETPADADSTPSNTTTTNTDTATFNVSKIAVSTKDIGTFPFFSLPEGIEYQNKAIERKFDRLFFPIEGKMYPLEGRVFKANLVAKENDEWSFVFFEKSYTEAITDAGGIKVFDGKVSGEELDRIKGDATYFGEGGSIDYWNEPVKTFIIRRPDGTDVYIQFSGNSSAGQIQILQKEPFKQTIAVQATFPFFGLPEGVVYQNKPLQRKYDKVFFPISNKMVPKEGRVLKAYLGTEEESDWSYAKFEKSFREAILTEGGVKVFEGKVPAEELKRIKNEAKYFGEEGSIDYYNYPVSSYIIKRSNGDSVFVQFSGNNSAGQIQILQKEGFKQTITTLKAAEIKSEIDKKGKAVLYINFEVDKATIKQEGMAAVEEIAKLLKENPQLKLSIDGHTDNSGNAQHNKKLSEDRAAAVKEKLVLMNISADKLKTQGFGSEKPLVSNDTEDNKAKNRRVELVKL